MIVLNEVRFIILLKVSLLRLFCIRAGLSRRPRNWDLGTFQLGGRF